MGDSGWHRRVTCPAIVLLLLSVTAVAGDLQQRIADCADIGNDGQRLACFDAIASGSSGDYEPAVAEKAETPPATAAASTAAEAPAQSPPISAPVPARDADKEKEVFNVRLTRCTKSPASGRQVYYLDNGEVWQQSNNSRKIVRNCDAAVTIEKDVFGYKMRVPSENRKIRISPVR